MPIYSRVVFSCIKHFNITIDILIQYYWGISYLYLLQFRSCNRSAVWERQRYFSLCRPLPPFSNYIEINKSLTSNSNIVILQQRHNGVCAFLSLKTTLITFDINALDVYLFQRAYINYIK